MSSTSLRSNTTFAALKVRNFRLYMTGQVISVSGSWMQAVAQGWLVLQLTGSPVGLGIAVALQNLPTMFFGFYGGLVADRLNKRKILYATQSVAGVLALTLGILVTSHHVTVTSVYVLAGLLGVVNFLTCLLDTHLSSRPADGDLHWEMLTHRIMSVVQGVG